LARTDISDPEPRMYDILAILLPFFLALCIVAVIRIVVEARLRRRLAETHATPELVESLVHADTELRRQTALKWGLVLLLIGLALCAIGLLGLGADNPASFGLLIAAAGGGMLVFHALRRPPPPG
jgi:peptidoglycan/LPS O-acetylase OafA/YrhL